MKEEEKNSQLASPPVDCCFVSFFLLSMHASFDGALTPVLRVLDRTKDSALCRGVLGDDVTLGVSRSIVTTTQNGSSGRHGVMA